MRDGQAAEEGEEQLTDDQFLRQLRADVEGVRKARSRPSLPLSVRAQKIARGLRGANVATGRQGFLRSSASLNSCGEIKAAVLVEPLRNIVGACFGPLFCGIV